MAIFLLIQEIVLCPRWSALLWRWFGWEAPLLSLFLLVVSVLTSFCVLTNNGRKSWGAAWIVNCLLTTLVLIGMAG